LYKEGEKGKQSTVAAVIRSCEQIGMEQIVIKKFREATKADAAGVVFLFVFSFGKPPRRRDQWMLRDVF
jgi:hypothetical protein